MASNTTSRKAKPKPRKGGTLGIHFPDAADINKLKERAKRFRRTPSDYCRLTIEIGDRAICENPALILNPQ
jgi:hypothetical protein